jgi:hypothetical protein
MLFADNKYLLLKRITVRFWVAVHSGPIFKEVVDRVFFSGIQYYRASVSEGGREASQGVYRKVFSLFFYVLDWVILILGGGEGEGGGSLVLLNTGSPFRIYIVGITNDS